MLDGKRILAVVPARGGSKGVPLKNLRPVLGTPLVGRVGQVVAGVPEIDRAVVSTDHEEIADVAIAHGLDAPFRRPEPIAGDRIGDWDVLHHALLETERLDEKRYDVVVMLQPTSPMRSAEEVRACLAMLVDGAWDAVWTVSTSDSKGHPLKQLVLANDGAMDYYDARGAAIVSRQQLTPVYHRNGVAYAITRACLTEQRSIKGARTGALVLSETHVSIDTEFDLALVEFLMQRGGRT